MTRQEILDGAKKGWTKVRRDTFVAHKDILMIEQKEWSDDNDAKLIDFTQHNFWIKDFYGLFYAVEEDDYISNLERYGFEVSVYSDGSESSVRGVFETYEEALNEAVTSFNALSEHDKRYNSVEVIDLSKGEIDAMYQDFIEFTVDVINKDNIDEYFFDDETQNYILQEED